MYTYPEKLICVTCRSLCPRPLEQQVERIAAANVKRLILREKDLMPEEYSDLAKGVLEQCRRYGIDCILHSFSKTAEELGVSKIHVPMVMLTHDLCRRFGTVGTSVHSVEEAVLAQGLGASYITAGHIFATDCKKGIPPRGLEFLKEVCSCVNIPVYAIGGINESNFDSVLEAGADGACVMSGMMTL